MKVVATNIFNILVVAILARNLSPSDFGLVAIAGVAINFLNIFIAQGSSQFVIYDNKEGREKRVHAAFWIDIALSITLTVIGYFIIPFVVDFYEEPELYLVLLLMLLQLPIESLSKIPDALLKKSLKFKALEIRDLILRIIAGVGSIYMALTGWGVWSLVIPPLMMSPIKVIVTYILVDWRPKLNFYFRYWPQIISYTSNIIGMAMTTFFISNGDSLIIGKVLGVHTLGIYNLAWQIANLIGRLVVIPCNSLSLPALAAVSGDIKRLANATAKIVRLMAIVSIPLLIGLLVVAEDFIYVVYGEQWDNAVLPLQIMIVYAIRFCVGAPVGAIFKVTGRPDIGFRIGLVTVPIYLIAVVIGTNFGIIGVACAVTLVRTASGLFSFYFASNLLNRQFIDLLFPIALPLAFALTLGLVVYIGSLIIGIIGFEKTIFSLLIQILIGGITSILLLRTKFNTLAEDISDVSARVLGKQNAVVKLLLNLH